jgi:hypothetical protein
MSPIGYVAAFRTYTWDDGIEELARRFFAAAPSSRQVVLVDETRGVVEIPGYEKISHTQDTVCPGLPNYPPGRSLWFNVDYGVYSLQRQIPDFDYYLLSESDLAVNVPLESMIRFATMKRIDLIAHKVEPSTPDWYWHSHGLVLAAKPWRSLLFFMVLSQRAIACLLAARRQLAQRFSAGEIAVWPFCEAFVPTVLKSTRGMRFADVSAFASTEDLKFRPQISLNDPRANRPGSLVHSVIGGKKFIAMLLGKHPPRDFFQEGSELREGLLGQAPFEDIVGPLRRALAKERDQAGVALLYEEAAAQGWSFDPKTDLAFCKPAISSSVSPWSRYDDPESDACGANDDSFPHDYGFHTRKEANPWWMVDLLGDHFVEEVAIVNRRRQQGAIRTFRIQTSLDGKAWTTRFNQTDPVDVSSNPELPWRVRFPDAFQARYLRVVLLGSGPLHLRNVQVLGRIQSGRLSFGLAYAYAPEERWPAGPTTDLAFCKPAVASSVSLWSRYEDPERDACGANDDLFPIDYGFHTADEVDPWWMVDLLDEALIEELVIVNRRIQAERFRTFRIESSADGIAWLNQFAQTEPSDVSWDPQSPWRVRFPDPFLARYLRIVLLGPGPLHLRRVQVFGRALPLRQNHPRKRRAEGGEDRWPARPPTDLAFRKPAVASSTSPWSRHEDPERDAGGANDYSFSYDYSFHTRKEANPWWMVDLLGQHLVEEVAIVNRANFPERFRTFRIETSSDGRDWEARFTQTDPVDVSTNPASPWRVHFRDPFSARYLRIILLGTGPLHLRRVQVLGRNLAPRSGRRPVSSAEPERSWPLGPTTDIALCKPAVASSVSPWSRYGNPEGETDANGESLPLDCGFQTLKEANPWWLVDFLEDHLVEEIVIVNRRIQPERFRTFRIETSTDNRAWTTRFTQAEPADVSCDPNSPWRMKFTDPFLARYLRIVLLGAEPLHLRQVQVLGRVVRGRSQPSGHLRS